jgi:hypothetical protein
MTINRLTNNYEYRLAISETFKENKFEYVKQNLSYLLYQTVYYGTIASLVGIGGGLVVTPIMFKWNADTKVKHINLEYRINC